MAIICGGPQPPPAQISITLPLEKAPLRRGQSSRRRGGVSASIAKMYIFIACRGTPLSPMPPAGGNFGEPRRNPAKRLRWGEKEGMERAEFSPTGGNTAERNFFRRGGQEPRKELTQRSCYKNSGKKSDAGNQSWFPVFRCRYQSSWESSGAILVELCFIYPWLTRCSGSSFRNDIKVLKG